MSGSRSTGGDRLAVSRLMRMMESGSFEQIEEARYQVAQRLPHYTTLSVIVGGGFAVGMTRPEAYHEIPQVVLQAASRVYYVDREGVTHVFKDSHVPVEAPPGPPRKAVTAYDFLEVE